jgi:PAS domain S-box-containing protein
MRIAGRPIGRNRELADARELLQATIDALPEKVVLLDARGEIIMENRAWADLAQASEIPAAAGVGANYLAVCDAVPPEEVVAARVAVGLRSLIEGRAAAFAIEYRCEEQWYRLRASRYASGIARVMVAHEDVTARHVAQSSAVAQARALLTATNYLRAVTDGMGEGLCTTDRAGAITYMNAAAEALLGWSTEELRGYKLHDLVHAGGHGDGEGGAGACPLIRPLDDGATVRVEDDLFIDRNGLALPVAYTSAPFVTDEGIDGCAVVFADTTERKARENALKHDAEALSWIGRVQDALKEDRFELYAQPILDLRSGEVVQRELLLRMREPDGEIVSPGAFLPTAERYGQIAEIDSWVIERATQLAAESGPVELNLSAHSIGDPGVIERIERCLKETGADPASLVFEITETALVANEVAAQGFADRLHELGCKLALDDFGTGYGGFTYLKQLPVDLLKIDIEFVRDLTTSPASQHVVEAVVALAGAFGLKTVAEGIEDEQTLEMVRDFGVDLAQGYFISRPEPIGEPSAAAHSPS